MLLPMKEKANIGAGHSAAAAGYTTIAGRAVGEYEEKKSRFIASLAHVETEAEALAFLEEIRAANRMARHNVYAYILRDAEGVLRAAPDVVGSGKAGASVAEGAGESSAAIAGGEGLRSAGAAVGEAVVSGAVASTAASEGTRRVAIPTPRVRYSDDGEPQKTAGLPTLQVLQHAGLTDVVAVVARYFGGVLLGTGGLVRAYTQATQAAVQAAELVVVSRCIDLTVRTSYANYESLLRIAADAGAKVLDTAFADVITLHLRMLDGTQPPFLQKLTELERGAQNVVVSEPLDAAF